jgi:hypothetical protein
VCFTLSRRLIVKGLRVALVLAAFVFVAACGGGGGGTVSLPSANTAGNGTTTNNGGTGSTSTALNVTPASLALIVGGSPGGSVVLGGTPPITASTTCPTSVVTFSIGTQSTTVTPVGVGSCALTFHDATGVTVFQSITVTAPGSGGTGSGTGGAGGSTGSGAVFATPLSANCITAQPGTESSGQIFTNTCNQPISVTYCATNANHQCNEGSFAVGQSSGTGWTASEVAQYFGSWELFVCPQGYTPVTTSGSFNLYDGGSLATSFKCEQNP